MANTAAASVEETIAPNSSDSFDSQFGYVLDKKRQYHRCQEYAERCQYQTFGKNRPDTLPVGIQPPAKRIKIKATTPRNCAIHGSSKYIPPGPSEPANIPIARNVSKAGMPNLPDALLANRLSISSKEAAIKICSIETVYASIVIPSLTGRELFGNGQLTILPNGKISIGSVK